MEHTKIRYFRKVVFILEKGLFYSYSDECKTNYFTNSLNVQFPACKELNYYSISSVIFESNYYKNQFEDEWRALRAKYNIPKNECLHFAEFKKLFSKTHIQNIQKYKCVEGDFKTMDMETIIAKYLLNVDSPNVATFLTKVKKSLSLDDSDLSAYSTFYDEERSEEQSKSDLKSFFNDLKQLLSSAEFTIINTDYVNTKRQYVNKGTKGLTKKKSNPPENIAKLAPRITFKQQLDLIIEHLLTEEIEGQLYLNQNLTSERYIKIRFDADGKNFDAKNDLKAAFNESLTIGTERFLQETAVKLLDEIRFIRKEEVGSEYTPPHCGSEVVDFICSLVCTLTRYEFLKARGFIDEKSVTINDYVNFKFIEYEDQDVDGVDFKELLNEKLILCRAIDHT